MYFTCQTHTTFQKSAKRNLKKRNSKLSNAYVYGYMYAYVYYVETLFTHKMYLRIMKRRLRVI